MADFYAQWEWQCGDLHSRSNRDSYFCREIAFGDGRRALTNLLYSFNIGPQTVEHVTRHSTLNINYLGALYYAWEHVFTQPIIGQVDVALRMYDNLQTTFDEMRSINSHFVDVTIEPIVMEIADFRVLKKEGFRIRGGVEIVSAFYYATMLARGQTFAHLDSDERMVYDLVRTGRHKPDYKWLYINGNGPLTEYEYRESSSKREYLAQARAYFKKYNIPILGNGSAV